MREKHTKKKSAPKTEEQREEIRARKRLARIAEKHPGAMYRPKNAVCSICKAHVGAVHESRSLVWRKRVDGTWVCPRHKKGV